MESYLKKKSPSLLKGYQQRYFKMQDQESKLVYYKKEPGLHDTPQGILDLAVMEQVQLKDKKKCIFVFKYMEREFELKADCLQLADQWVRYLQARSEQLRREQPQQIQRGESKESWRRQSEVAITKIQLENEQNILGNNLELVSHKENQEALLSLGIAEYFAQIDKEVLDRTVLMGYLVKNGSKNKLSFNKRWFLLVSAYSLLPDDDLRPQLTQEQLPGWLKVNTLYYFKSTDHNSDFKGRVSVSDMNNITKHDVTYSAQDHMRLRYFVNDLKKMIKNSEESVDYYSFSIQTQDKNITVFTDYLQVLNKWVDGLRHCLDKVKREEERVKKEEELNYEAQRQRMYEQTIKSIEEAKLKEKMHDSQQSLPSQRSLIPQSPEQSLHHSSIQEPSIQVLEAPNEPSRQQTINSSEKSEEDQRIVIKEGFVQYKPFSRYVLGAPYEQKYLRVFREGLELTSDFQSKEGLMTLPIQGLSRLENHKQDRFKVKKVFTGEQVCTIKCENQQTRDQYYLLVNQLIHEHKQLNQQYKGRNSLMNLHPNRFNNNRRMVTQDSRRSSMDSSNRNSNKSSIHSQYQQKSSIHSQYQQKSSIHSQYQQKDIVSLKHDIKNIHSQYTDKIETSKKGPFACCM